MSVVFVSVCGLVFVLSVVVVRLLFGIVGARKTCSVWGWSVLSERNERTRFFSCFRPLILFFLDAVICHNDHDMLVVRGTDAFCAFPVVRLLVFRCFRGIFLL